MRYINTLREGDMVRSIYLCKMKRSAETRNGKPYDNLTLQDKTGTLDGKVWDPNSGGIADYDEMDFVEVLGEVVSYNNNLHYCCCGVDFFSPQRVGSNSFCLYGFHYLRLN